MWVSDGTVQSLQAMWVSDDTVQCLQVQASNRLYKSMILPNLEYCCAVFHGCGKGNEEELERLQRRAARIVLKTVHLSTQDMASGLGWDPLKMRREKHIVKLVKNCLDGQAPSYFWQRTYDIHDYYTRSKDKLSVDKVNLELTKTAFFIRRLLFLMMVRSFVDKEAILCIDYM